MGELFEFGRQAVCGGCRIIAVGAKGETLVAVAQGTISKVDY